MEERIIDKEDSRKIKIKRTAEGGIADATDELAEDAAEGTEEELFLELPETDEYDEDLVGLTPSQLEAELKRREQAAEEAKREHDNLIALAAEALEKKDYAQAESLYSQALVYLPDSPSARQGLWTARTAGFTDTEPFYDEDNALELAQSDEETRAYVLERAGDKLNAERAALSAEIEPLLPVVTEAQEKRRAAFRANRSYYAVRFGAMLGAFVLAVIGILVSANYIVRTTTVIPVVLTAVFGGIALVFLALTIVYTRKLLVAHRLCAENEKLSSTEEGARLEELQDRLGCLDEVLFGVKEEE